VAYLTTQISVYLVLACLIGLSLGWLLWGELARRIRTEAAELGSKLADLEARHRTALTERDQFEKKVLDREGEIAGLRMRVLEPSIPTHEVDNKLQAAAAERESAIARVKDQQRVTLSLMEERDGEIIELRARTASLEAREQTMTARARALSQEWEAANSSKDGVIAELKSKVAQMEAGHQADAAEKNSQLIELKEHLSDSESKIQGLFTQHQVLASGQDGLRSALLEKDQRLRETKEQLDAASVELGRLRKIGDLLAQPLPHDEVVRFAHGYAAARNFQGGSEKEDWIRAENEVRTRLLTDYLAEGSSVAAGAA